MFLTVQEIKTKIESFGYSCAKAEVEHGNWHNKIVLNIQDKETGHSGNIHIKEVISGCGVMILGQYIQLVPTAKLKELLLFLFSFNNAHYITTLGYKYESEETIRNQSWHTFLEELGFVCINEYENLQHYTKNGNFDIQKMYMLICERKR